LQEHGRLKQVVYSTFSLLTSGAILAAVLVAADWYVWGLTYASDFRQPHRVKPQDAGNFVERIFARAGVASFAPTAATTASAATGRGHDEGHGFKQVA
jgi:hypothetical protein